MGMALGPILGSASALISIGKLFPFHLHYSHHSYLTDKVNNDILFHEILKVKLHAILLY